MLIVEKYKPLTSRGNDFQLFGGFIKAKVWDNQQGPYGCFHAVPQGLTLLGPVCGS